LVTKRKGKFCYSGRGEDLLASTIQKGKKRRRKFVLSKPDKKRILVII